MRLRQPWRSRLIEGAAAGDGRQDHRHGRLESRKMRRTPPGQASLLTKLRRFMPAGPVDAIRKGLRLQKDIAGA
jgi:hypothetical protein